jgi:hypothetical protein
VAAAATAPSPSPSPSSPPSGAAAIAGGRQFLLSEKALRDLRMDLSLVGASYYPLVLASVPSSSPASLPSGCDAAAADSSSATVFGDDDDDDGGLAAVNYRVNGSSASLKDIAFELGRAWMALRCYVPEALACFEASLRDQGEHPVTRFNIGLATYYGAASSATTTAAAQQQQQQQQQQVALLRRSLSEFTQCLAQSPGYSEASEWRQRVETKLKLLQQQPQSSQSPQQQQHQLQQSSQPQQPPQSLSTARVAAAVHANGMQAPSLHNPSSSLPAHLSPSFYAYSSPYL